MRKRRFKTKQTKRKNNYYLILLFIIIIPITAVFIGSRITERVVIPVLHSNPTLEEGELNAIINVNEEEDLSQENTENHQEDESKISTTQETELITNKLHPLSMYMIQVASVSDTSNIEAFVEELNEKNLPHLIYKLDNAYKIYTLGLTRRSLVESQLQKIREYYPDAYISEIHLPSKEVSYTKDMEAESKIIIKEINSLIEIMDKQAEEWYNFIEKESELNQYKELLIEQQEIIEQLAENLKEDLVIEGISEKKEIEKMIYHQESNTKRALELLENEDNIYRIHSLYLDSIFRTLETIK
ncbi:hypothetical protein SAMN05660297_00512 [Natronincola peptidivorans]|uniref:Sporulation related domain-containing protein n=1 Tax=Natronincola peptidivorans TaxID=426128 RepID=A0A1H9Z3N1_9FIRM|nr:hypothetical protein [Natronincola peptidivorans]SES75486.1 hypothetical protein SAMN05660297_00512 [Natronincola peptidivorans]